MPNGRLGDGALQLLVSGQPWPPQGNGLADGGQGVGGRGLSHRQAYGGIFAITVIKSLAVLFVIATFYVTGIV